MHDATEHKERRPMVWQWRVVEWRESLQQFTKSC